MALTRKAAARDVAPVDLPERPPRLPQEVVDRFPSLATWEDQWVSLWNTMRENLRTRDAEIERRLADSERRLTDLENP